MSVSLLWDSSEIQKSAALTRAMWSRVAEDAAMLERMSKGQKIAARKGQVRGLAHNRYEVQSQSQESVTYEVQFTTRGVSCECPDHQNRKTVCKHIISVIQQNSDLVRIGAGANMSDTDPALHHDNTPIKSTRASESGTSKLTAPTDVAQNGADAACVDNKEPLDKTAKPAVVADAAKGKATDEMDDVEAGKVIKKVVERLTASFPNLDIPDIADMPSKEAMIAIADVIDQLPPQDAAMVIEHAQPLILALRNELASDEPEMIININSIDKTPSVCPHCGADYIKYGLRHNKKGKTQTYLCKGLNQHRFTFNPGFERRRYPNATISKALRLYPKIRSAKEVADELETNGNKPHPGTISRWVKDIVGNVVKYLKKIGMKGIGDVWSTDELIKTVIDEGSCIAAVLDRNTRFCLAMLVSPTKDGQNAAELFENAKEMTGHNPLVTISDSLDAIRCGFDKVFDDDPCAILVRDAHIRNQWQTNNRHERFNSTMRDLFSGRRGRLTKNVLSSVWLHYNYLRTHMSLGGITPAEKAGMYISGPDKMMTLIQNAAVSKVVSPQPQWTENKKVCLAT